MDELNTSDVSKSVHKIVESRYENDKDTLDALKELSTFYLENTPYMRRNLRSQIELRNVSINKDFLYSFRKMKESFDDVYKDIASMSESVNDMTERLQTIKSQNRTLIEQTNNLQDKSVKIGLQKQVVQALISKFQLTAEEKIALHGTSRDTPITSDIFLALDRIREINSDCRALMQSGCQILAVDIMEQMNLHQEGALERLHRWTQNHCRNLDLPANTELVIEAMARLQDRPVLFKYVIEEYCTARRSLLVRAFIDALTMGGPDGNPPAMEMHAHDPQRYVGDMLAWLNQAIPIEKENLLILVKKCDKSDVSEHITKALANIAEGVVHPLKARIEKIVTVPAPSTSLYAVKNLIHFYRNTIGKVIKGGLLEATLAEMHDLSERVFLSALQTQVLTALARVEAPPRNLSPTPAVSHMLVVLKDVLSIASMVESHEKDIKKIVACILDPVIRAINEQASRLPTTDMAVYLLNCMFSMHNTLTSFKYVDERLERLQGMAEAQLDTLTSEQASSLVANLNLGPIYTILQDQKNEALSNIPGMEPIHLKSFVDKLDMLLDVPDMLLLPQILLLSSPEHRQMIHRRAFDVLSAIYKQLYEAVYNPVNMYQNPAAILSRTPQDLSKALNLYK